MNAIDRFTASIWEQTVRGDTNLLETYGDPIARGRIGVFVVELYGKGFVRVLTAQGSKMVGDYEKLVAIDGSDSNVQKKSAAGRAAGAMLTGGLNMLSSNVRGDLILILVTDKKTHTISTQVPDKYELEVFHTLRTSAQAILSANNEADADQTDNASADTVSAIEKLAEMHATGVLTDEEFSQAKQKLLGNE